MRSELTEIRWLFVAVVVALSFLTWAACSVGSVALAALMAAATGSVALVGAFTFTYCTRKGM